jgi:hypothetical protein
MASAADIFDGTAGGGSGSRHAPYGDRVADTWRYFAEWLARGVVGADGTVQHDGRDPDPRP